MKKNNASHRAWEHENQFLQHLCCENVNIPRVASKEGRFNFFKPPLWYQAVANIVHISLGVLQKMKLCFPRCVGSQKKSDSHAAWRAHSLFLQHLSGEIAVIQALPSLRSRRPTTPLQMERFQSPGGCVAGHVKLSGVPKCLRAASCMRTGGRAGRNERTQKAPESSQRALGSASEQQRAPERGAQDVSGAISWKIIRFHCFFFRKEKNQAFSLQRC